MDIIKKEIQDNILAFIKAYNFHTPIETIWGSGLQEMRVIYRTEYFDASSPNYQRGIGDIIVIFTSNYRVIIRQIISGTWCFALLSEPYRVTEEVWHLSTNQEKLLPNLKTALEAGYPYKNDYGTFIIYKQEK